ncbi:MAG TPA: ribbon-helix-helix domain-containing protein [Candidatus Obscuribacterales bacterium]
MKRVTARFSDKEHQGLLQLANQSERSMNDVIRDAVRQYLQTWGIDLTGG